jgi:hypothetical protein
MPKKIVQYIRGRDTRLNLKSDRFEWMAHSGVFFLHYVMVLSNSNRNFAWYQYYPQIWQIFNFRIVYIKIMLYD